MVAAADGNFHDLKSIISSGGKDGYTEVSVVTVCLQKMKRHDYHTLILQQGGMVFLAEVFSKLDGIAHV